MNLFRRIWSYTSDHKTAVFIGIVFSLVAVGAEKLNPYFTKLIIDDVLVGGEFERIGTLAGLLILSALVRSVGLYGRLYCFEHMSQKIIYTLRSHLYKKLQWQSFEFYDRVPTGLLMNRMVGDLNAVRDFLNKGIILFFEGLLSFALTFVIMFSLSVKLTLPVILIIPFLFLNVRRMSKVLKPVYRSIRKAFENLTSFVQESVTGIRVIKAFGREREQEKAFDGVARKFVDRNIDAADARAKYGPMSNFIMGAGLVVILLFGGLLVMQGEITIGSLVAFNGYMVMLKNPIMHMVNLVNQWENATASMEKIFELMDRKPEIHNCKKPVVLENTAGRIEFKNVYFKYRDEYVLSDINLDLKPGSVTAIMGATGSGKSTIINLIARFYDVTRGCIMIDGIDIRKVHINSLRSHIGIILQEVFLFSDTISGNIAFGSPDATREQIEYAAKIADAHDFIMELPQGYDTVVGERGSGLSGGQKQRIAIARAIVSNPRILILDDATSSVDMETEKEIQKTLKKVMENRTVLVVAHRISSVMDADNIIYLSNGEISEQGTHEQLLKAGGLYWRTFREQYREYA